jgi:outer membrane biosynthesis protein TonB
MATAEIPPTELRPDLYAAVPEADVPVLLVQLQDDLMRSRVREAFWISVAVHLLLVIAIVMAPPWVWEPVHEVYVLRRALLQNQELTYLEAPPDNQKVTKRPDTNIASDKDRIATTHKAPTIDRETLQRLLDLRRPGAPGAPGIQAPPAPPPVMAQGAGPNQQGPQARPPQDQNQIARLEAPPMAPAVPKGAFSSGRSPGAMIADAARAAAMSRGGGGVGGEMGLGPNASQGKIRSDIDIISDTMGVDFGPYLSRVLDTVRLHWYVLIPEIARAPLLKKGKVSIEFVIQKDGTVMGMALRSTSGDIALDRAAWGGITASNPFQPLPREFTGPYLALRFHFYYNPDKKDLE